MSEELTPLEAALAELAPVPARLDRDAVMYAAGRAAAPRRWLWPTATGFFALLSLILAVRLATRPMNVPPPLPPIVPASSWSEEEVPEPYGSQGSYLELRQEVVRRGELPPPVRPTEPATGAFAAPLLPTLERDLNLPRGSLDDVGPRFTNPSPNP